MVVHRTGVLAVTSSKHGNSFFYFAFLFFSLELIVVWIRIRVRIRVSISPISAIKTLSFTLKRQ